MDQGAPDAPLGRHAKALWIAKLVLRGVSFTLCLPLIGLSASLLYLNSSGVVVLPQACLVLCWDAAEIITLSVRRRAYKGIHPGVCVGVDLLLWLGLLAAAILGGVLMHELSPSMLPAAVAISVLLLVVQITLFIIACVETHRRNFPKAVQNRPRPPPAMMQPRRPCATCAPGMSCAMCAPPMGNPASAAQWQYNKPEQAGQHNPPPSTTQPSLYPMAAPMPAQHEMPINTPPAGQPRYEMWTGSTQPQEMWTANAPPQEMYAQNAGHGNRQELPPQ